MVQQKHKIVCGDICSIVVYGLTQLNYCLVRGSLWALKNMHTFFLHIFLSWVLQFFCSFYFHYFTHFPGMDYVIDFKKSWEPSSHMFV